MDSSLQNKSMGSNASCLEISSEEDIEMIITKPETTNKTPERSPRTGRNLLLQLNSTLSPKFTEIEKTENGRRSRYGRQQKSKDFEDGFVPSELTRFVSKSGPVTFETMRIIKTPTKIVPESEVVTSNNNNDSNANEKTANVVRAIDDLGVDMTETEKVDEENPTLSQLDAMEQLSDVDSGRGSVVDAEFAALMTQYPEGELYWAEYKVACWWPCIIAPDPDGNPLRNDPRSKVVEIHVKYLADKRAWIAHNKLVPYVEYDDLLKSHKVNTKANIQKKLFPRSIFLGSFLKKLPIEQRLTKLYEEEEKQAEQRTRKRKSKELLDRSATPESPAFEDITDDAESIKSDLNLIRQLTGKRKSPPPPEIHPKRIRFSRRSLELKNRPKIAEETPLNVSLPAKISKAAKKDKKEEPEDDGLTIEERLRKEFMTKDFHYLHMYPDHAIKREFVCRLCYRTKNLKKCNGCYGHFHEDCVSKVKVGQPIPVLKRGPIGFHKGKKGTKRNSVARRASAVKKEEIKEEEEEEIVEETSKIDENAGFLCFDCETKSHKCFICNVKGESEEIVQCNYNKCMRFYHKKCLKPAFPQTTVMTDDRIVCPYHKCHTCFASDSASLTPDSKLVMCVLCPTSYHYNDVNCIPAGTEWLSTTQIICQNHSIKPAANINANWCFICTRGGDLICCETCPGAFHLTCVNEAEVPQGKYVCDSCSSGRRPLHNELVWAKIGNYRFWPAIVLAPQTVPLSMVDAFHYPNDFCVKFFGTRDCAWVGRDRVFVIEEEDAIGRIPEAKGGLEAAFAKAISELRIVQKMLKADKLASQQKTMSKSKPDPYVKIQINRAVPPIKLEMDVEAAHNIECQCKPTDEDPCGITSQCLNRSSKQECNPHTCPAQDKCNNQLFQKRTYPKLQERNTHTRGWGLFAEEDIKEGTFVIEYVGEVINTKEMNRRMEVNREKKIDNFYFMDLVAGQIIDAGEKGNKARFINHSCMPNCVTEMWQVGRTVRIGIFALRDIKKDEELSFDYQLECKGNVQKPCMCGTSECRGFIGPKKKDARRSSTNSARSSSPTTTTSKKKSTKRKSSFSLKIQLNKKKKTAPSSSSTPKAEKTNNTSKTIEIDDDLEVRAENFTPASPNGENSVASMDID
ncbi:nuclear receptor binding SET domain protein [Culicoides brevitarsis]|uniref:nuclear receptor binding SET domain protein n=1 Tax=Culicoides brevitarsis TaxID=469753 RepID=UPI00307C4879